MSFLSKNLEILSRRNPGAAESVDRAGSLEEGKVVHLGQGLYTMVYTERNGDRERTFHLHSSKNPLVEARRFAQAHDAEEDLLLYGFGLGYHVEELAGGLDPDRLLHVFECNLPLVRVALELTDFSTILAQDNLHLHLSQAPAVVARALSKLVSDAEKLSVHPASLGTIPADTEDGLALREVLEGYLSPGYSPPLAALSEANMEKNALLEAPHLARFTEDFQAEIAVVASSGPSLKEAGKQLSRAPSGAKIIAVGSAFRPLMMMGVQPDVVVIVDPQEHVAQQLNGLETSNVPLAFLDTASHSAVRRYKGPRFMFTSAARQPGASGLETGGSCSLAATSLAVKMGAKKVVMVGQDLCFPGGEHHADGSMYGEDEQVLDSGVLPRTRDRFGNFVSTTVAFLRFRRWLAGKIGRHPEVEFVNASPFGLEIPGARFQRLEDAGFGVTAGI